MSGSIDPPVDVIRRICCLFFPMNLFVVENIIVDHNRGSKIFKLPDLVASIVQSGVLQISLVFYLHLTTNVPLALASGRI